MKLLMMFSAALLCFAQNATVYDLAPAESSEGARLYREMKTADDAYHAWEGKINSKYSAKEGSCIVIGMTMQCGAELDFTDDFKHAVPKSPAPQQAQGYHPPCLGVAW